MINEFTDAINEWNQERAQAYSKLELKATEVARRLKAQGMTKVDFIYSGAGDSGCIDEFSGRPESITISDEDQSVLEELVYEYLPLGWELGNGSEGSALLDLDTGELSFEHKYLEYIDESVAGVTLELDD